MADYWQRPIIEPIGLRLSEHISHFKNFIFTMVLYRQSHSLTHSTYEIPSKELRKGKRQKESRIKHT